MPTRNYPPEEILDLMHLLKIEAGQDIWPELQEWLANLVRYTGRQLIH